MTASIASVETRPFSTSSGLERGRPQRNLGHRSPVVVVIVVVIVIVRHPSSGSR